MSKNIYVGNLSFQTTGDDLRDMFSAYGDVTKAQVTTDRETGQSRGFGFVEMSSGGDEAIEGLNGTQNGGRTLTVNEAKPREPRAGGSGGGSYGGNRSGGSSYGGNSGSARRDRY